VVVRDRYVPEALDGAVRLWLAASPLFKGRRERKKGEEPAGGDQRDGNGDEI
jgi:hypothetical protein